MSDTDDFDLLPPLIKPPPISRGAKIWRLTVAFLAVGATLIGVLGFVFIRAELERIDASKIARPPPVSAQTPVPTRTPAPIATAPSSAPLLPVDYIELQYVPEYSAGSQAGVVIVVRVTNNQKAAPSRAVSMSLQPPSAGAMVPLQAVTDGDGLFVARFIPAPGGTTTATIRFTSGESIAVARLIPMANAASPQLASDSDQDGLTDIVEAILGTNRENPDTDGDGMWDGDEYYRLKTDPISATARIVARDLTTTTVSEQLPNLFLDSKLVKSILIDQPEGQRVFVLSDTLPVMVIATYWITSSTNLTETIEKGNFVVFPQQSGMNPVYAQAAPKEYWLWSQDAGSRKRISMIGFIPGKYLRKP